MELKVSRNKAGKLGTFGELSVDGKFFGYTVEPGPGKIIHGPIPAGKYRVSFVYSPRYERRTIRICDVPGREGILMHAGNWAFQSKGCIIVGLGTAPGMVTKSKNAMNLLDSMVKNEFDAGNEISILVEDSEKQT